MRFFAASPIWHIIKCRDYEFKQVDGRSRPTSNVPHANMASGVRAVQVLDYPTRFSNRNCWPDMLREEHSLIPGQITSFVTI